MDTRSSTQPAVPDSTQPNVEKSGRAPTQIAQGAIPPANPQTGPISRPQSTFASAATAPPLPSDASPKVAPPGAANRSSYAPTDLFDRAARVGTHMQGAQGLSSAGSESPKVRLTLGKVIPGTRYRIIRWLGEGGMGVVYEAEHVDIERRVALKILRFDLSRQPKMIQVFKDEAKAAGRLGSQYLVDLYDFGELADGRLFFAMELLDGEDLVPADEHAFMPPDELIPVLRQLCKGLGVAHKAGVVHRDIKPENIIRTSSADGRQQIKIVDFGISSMLAAGQQGDTLAGTPHYMAPELITAQPYDGRLDIYALGCMAYEMLVGRPPFESKTIETLLEKQVTEVPVSPRVCCPQREIPGELDSVIMRCLAKEPNARFRDTADLEAALCEAQIAAGITTAWDDLPLPDLPDDPQRHATIAARMPSLANPPKKRGWVWPVVAAASSLVAVGLAGFLILGRGPTEDEMGEIDILTADARSAAARANWIVPPLEDLDADTAYKKVRALEDLEGSAEDMGDERGIVLRQEFAGTLIKQADELWDFGVKDLAQHYYFQSLVFDDSSAYAFERSNATPGMLSMYIDRANNGKFNDSDRVVSSLAAAELEQDPEVKEERMARAQAMMDADESSDLVMAESPSIRKLRSSRKRSKKPTERDEAADEVDPLVAMATRDAPAVGETAAVELDENVGDEPEVEAPAVDESTRGDRRRSKKHRKTTDPTVLLGKAERDPERAATLADEGMKALRAGRRSEASSLFNQAISNDRKNAKALMGLSDVYFDTGKNQKALEYAEKAVRASPANRSYRLKLGDAYFKVLRYKDALEQYEQAKKRGSTKADARIAKVHAKLGG